ncbi:MAG: hypothetical protein AAF827_16120 [Cyanobacteria bacterium P01_D01_bin.6]
MAPLKLRQLLVAMTATVIMVSLPKVTQATTQPLSASLPDFPITQLRWWNWNSPDEQPWQSITLTVPDQDTTHSAYGGRLRRYDVHVAKMIEVSHHYCQQDDAIEGFRWDYEAANGNVYMGRFEINCELTQTIVTAYGPQRTEQTAVSFVNIQPDETRENPYARDDEIPVLSIDTNAKIQRWRQYVQTVRPRFVSLANETMPFPAEQVFSQLARNVNIPVLIPSEMPNHPLLAEWIQEKGVCVDNDSDGHGYSLSVWPCEPRPSRRIFDSFYARAIEHLPQSALDNADPHIAPQDTWLEVKLTRGVTGTFRTSCGPYCTASLTWDYQGIRYFILARFGNQPFMTAIANSAIEAGDRRFNAH